MKRVISIFFGLCSLFTLSAQTAVESLSERSNARGVLMNRDLMSVAEMGQFSQSTFQFGTARSMAMAGAMTSLGGDATAMLINPAGLGMYRSSEFGLTPLVTVQRSDSEGGRSSGRGDNSFSLSNFSAVFALPQSGTSPLLALNVGIGYNRISNLNYSYSLMSGGQSSSLARLFSRQLTGMGVSLTELRGDNNPNWNSLSTAAWGAALGYKNGLTFQSYGVVPEGYDNATADDTITESTTPIWTSSWMNSSTVVDQYFTLESEGSVGEYDLSIGGNVMNKIYFGFTFGIQSVYQRLDLLYSEEYYNSVPLDSEVVAMNYNQTVITSGVGLNLKVGATYRPVEALRIGVAYHSPTWYSLSREYQASMASVSQFSDDPHQEYYSSADSPILGDYGENRWRFNSPSRLLVGGSYTFGKRALISIDYQRDWVGSMKVRELPYGVDTSLYTGFDELYESVNTLRVGGEFKPTAKVALRGGYGCSSSMVSSGVSSADLLDIPTTDRVRYFSAGIGYAAAKNVLFDLTYMNQVSYCTSYTLFYGAGDVTVSSVGGDAIPSAAPSQSGTFKSDLRSHNIALSMVLKM
ncbi:MAG: outer membrane protein transport protein [Rikenellaceae bacterium]